MATADTSELVSHLVRRGIVPRGADVEVRTLTGGVSGEVGLVTWPGGRVVTKHALERLAVAAEWTAKPERTLTEAAALELCHAITPAHTPAVIDVDPATLRLTMTAAPSAWPTWKDMLLGDGGTGHGVDPEHAVHVAGTLGGVLGQWHRTTWHDPAVAARFDDYEALEQLRVTPFHRATAAHHPQVREQLTACAEEILTARDCLVHGDFSPKNVLVGIEEVWVLDFEVAHVGAAVFDLAFVQTHLLLKACHRPRHAAVLAGAARHLLDRYTATLGADPAPTLGRHVAALLLARVDGTSPAAYLDEHTRTQVRGLALEALCRDESIDEVWQRAELAGSTVSSRS